MRIGIDYRAAWAHAPGAGRYARELVRALVRLPAPPELALFELGRAQRRIDEDDLGIAGSHAIVRRRRGPWPRRALPFLAKLGLAADQMLGGVELFQQVEPVHVPVRHAKQVAAVAELPPPDTAEAAEHARRLRALDGVLVFSEAGRERVVESCGVDPARVHLTPVGCEHWARALAKVSRDAARADGPRSLVALGALTADSRPIALLEAVERLRERGLEVQLTHAGRRGSRADDWLRRRDASRHAEALRWIEDPAEAALPPLVAGADLVVHLQRDALTPVTALEACALGPAVVADRLPALDEALGELAEWVEPGETDAEVLADALARGLERARDEDQRAARRALAERYDWRRCALATQTAWRRVLAP